MDELERSLRGSYIYPQHLLSDDLSIETQIRNRQPTQVIQAIFGLDT